MRLSMNVKALYNLISSPIDEGYEYDRDSESWKDTKTETGIYINKDIEFNDMRIPFPFYSLNGSIGRLNEFYTVRLALFFPTRGEIGGLKVKKGRTTVAVNQVKSDQILSHMAKKINKEYGEDYLRLGTDPISGYIRIGGANMFSIEQNSERDGEETKTGLEMTLGGSGQARRRFGSIGDFTEDLVLLSGFVTRRINDGIEKALQMGFVLPDTSELKIRI